MYTIVGLGNPGGEYNYTRHNTGRMIVEKMASEGAVSLKQKKKPDLWVGTGDVVGEQVRLVLPDTFMNNSGKAVAFYIKSVSAAKKLVVVYDDIDLPLGVVRVAFGSSSGGHNGVKSVERALKTKDFIKVRVGVAKAARGKAKKPVGEKAVLAHLLSKFSKKEHELVVGGVYERVLVALAAIFESGDPVKGMNAVNGLPLAS
ncbi:MAG: aminoacyl-tRNA hydrolase [Patescibacteria group bacterium]